MSGYYIYEVIDVETGRKYTIEADTINQAKCRVSFLGEVRVRRLYGREAKEAKKKKKQN